MIDLACLSHWYVQLLFAGPAVGILGWMGKDSLRRRRERRRTDTSVPPQSVTLRG